MLKRLKYKIIGFLVLFICAFILVIIISIISTNTQRAILLNAKSVAEKETETLEEQTEVVNSPTNGEVIMYLQGDSQWGKLPYAGSTIKSAGCGLTSAAMAFTHLTGESITPKKLLEMVGSSCLTNNLNNMGLFCNYGAKTFGLKHSGQYLSLDKAIEEVKSGKLVFISVSGLIRTYYTPGHIMLIWKIGEDGSIYIRDPASYTNSITPFSKSEMRMFTCKYFYSIWK